MHKKLLLLIAVGLLSQGPIKAQLSFTQLSVPGFSLNYIGQKMLRDQNTWLMFAVDQNSQELLFKTTNAGASYTPVTTLPSGFSQIKWLSMGDTIFAVGNMILRSYDFGFTWAVIPPPAAGEDYDDIVRMPDGHIWISAAASGVNRLYQTDLSFSTYTLRYSEISGFPAVLHNRFKFLSSFSNDTVYFNFRDTTGKTFMKMTTDNGQNWTNSQSLLPAHNLLSGTRISYIKYHNGKLANIFVFYSGATTDYVTNNGFVTLQKDTLDPIGHVAHEVYDWLECSGKNYLVYDNHEDSSYGIQQIQCTADKRIIYDTLYDVSLLNVSQKGNFALGGRDGGQITLASNLCEYITTGFPQLLDDQSLRLFPNPATGILNVDGAVDRCRIYSLSGKLQADLSIEKNNRIDISFLEPGIYLLNLKTGEEWGWMKMVKNND